PGRRPPRPDPWPVPIPMVAFLLISEPLEAAKSTSLPQSGSVGKGDQRVLPGSPDDPLEILPTNSIQGNRGDRVEKGIKSQDGSALGELRRLYQVAPSLYASTPAYFLARLYVHSAIH